MLTNITSFRDVYQANDSRLTTFDRSDVFLNVSQPPEGANNLDAGTLAKLRIFSLTGNPTLGVVAGIRDAQGRTYIEVFHHFMCTVVHHARPWEEYDVVAAFKGIPGNPQDNAVIRFPRDWFLPHMETTQTPTEAELMGIEDPTTLAATYLLNPTVPLHNDRFVVIPPFLVEIIGNAESKYDRPAILFNAINAISAKAAEYGDAQLQHATYRIVQFLWRLTTEAGATGPSIINENDLRTNDSHTLALRAHGIERQWWGGKQNDPVAGLVALPAAAVATPAKDTEKQSWDHNLSERAAHMILILSTQLNDAILPLHRKTPVTAEFIPVPETEPVASYKKFLTTKSKTQTATLDEYLRMANIDVVANKKLTALTAGAVLSPRETKELDGSFLSIFHFATKSARQQEAKPMDQQQLDILIEHKLAPADAVKAATTLEGFTCKTKEQLIGQIGQYRDFLTILFGKNGPFPRHLSQWLYWLTNGPRDQINNIMDRHEHFSTTVLGLVDSRFHNFLTKCAHATNLADIDFVYLCAYTDIETLIEGGIRDIPLYCKDLIAKLERQEKPKPAKQGAVLGAQGAAAPAGPARGGGGNLPAAKKPRVDEQRVFNPTPLQEWLIKDNRLLNHIRTTMSREPFEIDGTQVCIGYQCSGSCKKGVNCAYVSTHIPLTGEHKAGFGAWLQKARENFGNNNAKKPAE
jgi:hypothetical protein